MLRTMEMADPKKCALQETRQQIHKIQQVLDGQMPQTKLDVFGVPNLMTQLPWPLQQHGPAEHAEESRVVMSYNQNPSNPNIIYIIYLYIHNIYIILYIYVVTHTHPMIYLQHRLLCLGRGTNIVNSHTGTIQMFLLDLW